MDGITFTNATNQFTEMLPGVTIDLHQETTGNVTVQVAHDSDAMADKIQAILDEYNSAISFFKSQFTFSGEARSDTLMGDPSARAIKSQIQTAMGGEVSDLTTYTIWRKSVSTPTATEHSRSSGGVSRGARRRLRGSDAAIYLRRRRR
jgi:flagellar capping protein FliD